MLPPATSGQTRTNKLTDHRSPSKFVLVRKTGVSALALFFDP